MANYSIEKSDIAGKGLYAKKLIKKDQAILTVKGTIKREAYAPGYLHLGPRWLALDEEIWLAPSRDNPWRFINHSCFPNAGLKGRVNVVAMKKIMPGKEITIDYSITEDDPYWEMMCKCGQKNCRKLLRSVRFLPKKLFDKYKNYIPVNLQKCYLKANRK